MYFFGLRASPTPQDLKYGLIFKIGCVVQKLDVFQIMGIHARSSCNWSWILKILVELSMLDSLALLY